MIAAVVLNYRTSESTIEAVLALRESTVPVDLIVVVDNASNDGSVERLRTALKEPTLMVADANGGFSAGCNLGIREALAQGAHRVLLLNADVTVAADMVERLTAAMTIRPTCGIAGPMLLRADAEDLIESTGIRYSSTSGRMRHDDFGAQAHRVPRIAAKPVDGVSGCAMLISRQVFDRVGGLADEFFFGFEDLDFCLRAKREGFEVLCIPEARAWHTGSASIGRDSPARLYFAARNHLLLASRSSLRPGAGSLVRAPFVVLLNVAHAVAQHDVPRVRALRATLRGVADHVRRRYGPPPDDLA